MTMVVALSYSARWEITQAVKDIINEHENQAEQPSHGPLTTADITEDLISKHMQTSFMPDPDLLIRTGGELRISNYLLWQIDRKSTRLNSSHANISYAVFCLKKK